MGPQGAVPEWGRQIGVSKWSDGQMVPLTAFRSNSKFNQKVECPSLKYDQPITVEFCIRDVCKISLWSLQCISNQSTENFGRISNSIEMSLVGRAPGQPKPEKRHRFYVFPIKTINIVYIYMFENE